jgi:iron complex outermembrane receptor protein
LSVNQGVKHKVLLGGEYYFSDFRYTVANDTVDTINIFDANVPTIPDAEINRYRNLPPDYRISTDSSSQAIYLKPVQIKSAVKSGQ